MSGCALDLDQWADGLFDRPEPPHVEIGDYDLTIAWLSGGKDGLAALNPVVQQHDEQGVPRDRLVVGHNWIDEEWPGTLDLVRRQAAHYGLPFVAVRRSDGKTILDQVADRGMWPDAKRRWCTSDHKRGPGRTVLTRLVGELGLDRPARVLQVYGFRAAESPARARKEVLTYNQAASGKGTVRQVWDWNPIHHWPDEQVWQTIHDRRLPFHWAYLRGMRRLSCVLCVLAPTEALVTAARLQPLRAARYLAAERQARHSIKQATSMLDVITAAGWDEPQLMAMLAGEVPPPDCPLCNTALGGAWPTERHPVADDVAAAMFGRHGLTCDGSRFIDPDTGRAASPFDDGSFDG